jgi:hypothetical protein
MKNIYYKNIVNLYKTILNSFIYFYWLGRDQTDEDKEVFTKYPTRADFDYMQRQEATFYAGYLLEMD